MYLTKVQTAESHPVYFVTSVVYFVMLFCMGVFLSYYIKKKLSHIRHIIWHKYTYTENASTKIENTDKKTHSITDKSTLAMEISFSSNI